jgi:hypothetical protein
MDLAKLFEEIWEVCGNHPLLVFLGFLAAGVAVLIIVDAQRSRKNRPRHRGGKRF